MWHQRGEGEAQQLLDAIEERTPGFKEGNQGLAWRHVEDWEREIGLLGDHPMHLDITMDQVGPFRPLPELSRYRSPVAGCISQVRELRHLVTLGQCRGARLQRRCSRLRRGGVRSAWASSVASPRRMDRSSRCPLLCR